MLKTLRQSPLIFITTLFTAILLLNINNPHVPFTDELLFEEASFNAAQGNWIIPQLQDQPWLEKPPLYFWLTAPIFHLAKPFLSHNPLDLDQSLNSQNIYLYPWIRRSINSLFAIGAVITTAYLSRKIFPQVPHIMAPLILIATPGFIYTALAASLDIPTATCIAISFLSLLYLKTHPKFTSFIFILSTSAAIMFRSVFGLTPFIFLLYYLFTHQLNLKKTLLITLSILTLILPWHIYAYLQYPQEFINTYLGFNIIGHSLQIPSGYATTSFYYYAILLSIPPWFATVFIYTLYKISKSKLHLQLSHPHILLIIYFSLPFIFLSISATRHPWYSAQLTIPLALLTSYVLHQIYQTFTKSTSQDLSQITFLALILTPLTLIIGSSNNSTSSIQALHYAISQFPNQTIYSYQQPYLPNSKLYHPAPVQTINDDFLLQNTNPLTVYINESQKDSPVLNQYQLKLLGSFPPGGIYQISPNPNNP